MPNYDRANRDPANRDPDGRVFDGGEDVEENEGSHLPVVIIITILVLAAFGGVVWLAYNQGVARGRGDMPVRIATAQPVKNDTAKTEDGGLKVYQQPAGTEEGDAPAAKPEAAQTPVAQPPAAQQPVAQAPVTPPPAPAQPAPKPVTQSYPPPIVAPPPKTQTAAAKPVPAAPQVATKPPAQLVTPQTATLPPKPAPLPPAKLVETPKPAAVGGGYLLQIGAYKSEAEARAAWKTYQGKHAALLNGFSPDVQQTTHPDGSIWYRLRIASFADKTAASALCDRLKSQGGACFLSK